MTGPDAPRWSGRPGFYEVYYLTLTDRGSGIGLWLRWTMLAPRQGEPTCALWALAMDPALPGPVGGKDTFPIAGWHAAAAPFAVRAGTGELDAHGARGAVGDVGWDLTFTGGGAYAHVHPLLERAGVARTVLTLPRADLAVAGTLRLGDREIALDRARGGQAHLWGTKHAARWAWAHANDLEGLDGSPRPGAFVDGVTVWVPRLGRPEVGPSTPVVARLGGRDLLSTSPRRVLTNASRATLTSWAFTARGRGGRRLEAEVTAPRDQLAGVTYSDPDGERAYCYNTEVATLRLTHWERDRLLDALVAPGRCHFEYAQREPVPGIPLLTT